MSRRIDIELTSALPDNSWTWRAAGAKQPKGTLDGSILSEDAGVGDVLKVDVEQEVDGIRVLSVVGGRTKQDRGDVLELLPSEREFKPVIETKAKRDRNDRGGRDDRRPRRDRDDRSGRPDRGGRDGGRDGRPGGRSDGGARTDNRGGGARDDDRRRDDRRGRRSGPSFTPPPEIPQRPKPKRLKPGKQHRTAVLNELPDEQRGIAELALQGMPAVRQRLREENAKAVKDGRSPMPEASVLKIAEDLLPRLRVAEWLDRAEAAQRQMEHLDLRDLRSVVAGAGDPAVARDETAAALAKELTEALAVKQEQELRLWFGDVDAALAVGRVIRALRLSSQPPKAGVPFPSDIAQRLVDSANASLAPMDSPERWIAMLEAAAFSPVRAAIAPVRKPDVVNDELLATVKRLGPALPQIAALFEIEVNPKAPMPKPLRQGPRNPKGERSEQRPRTGSDQGRPKQGTGTKTGGGAQPAATTDAPAEVVAPDATVADEQSVADTEPVTQPVADTTPDPEMVTEPTADTTPDPEPDVDPVADTKLEAAPDPGPVMEPVADTNPDTTSSPEPVMEPVADTTPDAEPTAETASDTDR